MRSLTFFVVGALTAAFFACSSEVDDASTTHDADTGVDAATPPEDAAPEAAARVAPTPLPVIPNQGGPVLANPELVTITWAGDPIADDLEAFDQWWGTSDTWKTIMAEWGVGPAIYSGKTRLQTAAPATLGQDDIANLLLGGFADGSIPAPNGSRIYMIYPPAGTVVTQEGGYQGCVTFQAYHLQIDVPATATAAATKAYYGVTPRCAETSGMTPLDYTTWGSSHEAMEAASDPQYDRPAWRIDMQTLLTPELGENADLCAGQPTKVEGHQITRNWSNVAAKAGERPCVPAPDGPMFGLFADPGDLAIKPGETKTLTLHAYAASTYPAFAVGVYAADPELTATIDKEKARDGDDVTLTVTATASFVEYPGQNLVFLYGQGSDYLTKRHLIVHAGR